MESPALSVLVIDPDPRSAHFLGNFLTQKGYTVSTSTSAKEGYISALRDRPAALIFDPVIADMPAIELTRRLRSDKRTASTLLIALTNTANAEEMGQLLAAGLNEYLVKSQDSLLRLGDLLSSTDPHLADTQPGGALKFKRQGGLLIAFLSAKGGTGTSSMCANIAQVTSFQRADLETAVVDLVLPIGSIAQIVGYEGDFNLTKAALHPLEDFNADFLRRTMSPLETWEFRLLAGIPNPEAANALDASRIPVIISMLRRAFDVIFVDLGRALSRISLPIIEEADTVVIVTASDLATATLTKTVWNYLATKNISPKNVYTLLNRAVGLEGVSKSDAEKIIGLPIQATIPYMGANFSLANNQHIPILRKLPHDTAALMIDQVSRQILEIAQQTRAQ